MAERILFEYRADETGDNDCANHKPCKRAWNAHSPVLMSCCDWHTVGMTASQGMKPGVMDDTLAFFEGMYREIFRGEERE